jgi:uncharacterized damage-inducible protein DinB
MMLPKRLLLVLAVATMLPAVALRAEEPAAPAAGALSDADRQALIDTLERGRAETDALLARAEGETFTRKPAPERWSVAEVLEHMTTTEELLLGMVEKALASPPDPDAAGILAAVPIAGFAERVQDRSQPAQAPEALHPKGGLSRDEAIARYHATRERSLAFLRTTQGAVGAHTAPVPSGKLTAHHLLTVLANHNLRHNKQIAEALEQLAAPAAAAAPAPAAQR